MEISIKVQEAIVHQRHVRDGIKVKGKDNGIYTAPLL